MDTKEKILETALELFSQRGFDGTSMREIARALGIRESSLYNHFAGKQAIFDAIVETCLQRAERYFRENALPFDENDGTSVYQGLSGERLYALIERTFQYFFEDLWNVRFRRLLLISQFADGRCRELYKQFYRDKFLQIQAHVFSGLMDAGELRREDPAAVAMEFFGPVFLLVHTCDSLEEARTAIRIHVEQFRKNYSQTV